MTEQLKAEAFVREARPALMEYQKISWVCATDCDWFCNKCKAGESNVPNSSIPNALICPKCKSNGDFISHPLNLQDWLGVIAMELTEDCTETPLHFYKGRTLKIGCGTPDMMCFNLTTGQPATEADYKAFNDIVSV